MAAVATRWKVDYKGRSGCAWWVMNDATDQKSIFPKGVQEKRPSSLSNFVK